MARALFLSLPLAGHINPSLPLARELVARGDEVFYCATESYAGGISETGAQYRAYRNGFLADMKALPEQLEALSWLLMRTTAEVLAEQLKEFRELRPDYVITDSVAPWGYWVAEILGVPVVTSVVTFAFNRPMLGYAAKHGVRPRSARLFLSKLRHVAKALRLGRQLRKRYGARGPGITGLVMGRSELNIVYTSREFQPLAETFDERYVFVGPSTAERRDAGEFPWEELRGGAVVYISLGTLFNREVGFYRDCFEAFGGEDFQVILSAGTNVTEESLGAAPANFLVRAKVPQLAVLQRAAAFVTHGGMNSVNESLCHGVPLVVVPQMSEQAIVGRRVEELGAGIYLAKEDVTPERLRTAVHRVLTEEGFRRQAGVLRESLRAAGGAAKAADAIRRFTRKCASCV